MKKRFSLPDKFCVWVTDRNYFSDFLHTKLINEEGYLTTWSISENFYFHYPFIRKKSIITNGNNFTHSQQHVESGYKEITFQQFEKYFVSKFNIKEDYNYLIPLLKNII